MILTCADKRLDLSSPQVMGILNITPDSFSDGGAWSNLAAVVDRAALMVRDGAALLDVGGESTRPGAEPVALEEELSRVVPVIEALAARFPVPVSVDTSKPEVMRAAVAAGAGLINDVYALRRAGALAMAAALKVPVCLMHMQGEPHTMQHGPGYGDVVAEVKRFLAQRISACLAAGIGHDQILVDPGIGFGKTLSHNLALLKGLERLQDLAVPVLVGVSRKSMIGAVLDVPVERRLIGSVAAAVVAAQQGAAILRVHDVTETVQALRICHAIKTAE